MTAINFSPFPILQTERLLLRRLDKADVGAVYALRSDELAMKYIPRPLVSNYEEALEHIAMIDSKITSNEGINWAITLKGSPGLIGIIGHYRIKPEHFRAEVGYMILPEFNNQGIITEALATVVRYGFDVLKLHSIEAIIDPGNTASARVLEKNGFIREAHLRENEYYEGRFLDTVIYSLIENPTL